VTGGDQWFGFSGRNGGRSDFSSAPGPPARVIPAKAGRRIPENSAADQPERLSAADTGWQHTAPARQGVR
jgi:hypothetical protein